MDKEKEVQELRRMLSEMSTTSKEEHNIDRQSNVVSSVGAAFGSFNHELIKNGKNEENEK